ncbi:MAG: hypothetical protein ACRDHE_05255, partial [Ktedonobacterales bacterium]
MAESKDMATPRICMRAKLESEEQEKDARATHGMPVTVCGRDKPEKECRFGAKRHGGRNTTVWRLARSLSERHAETHPWRAVGRSV